jgi:hypothetical protein
VDVDRPLQKRVGGASEHDRVEDPHDLTALRGQDGCAEDPVRFRIDHELHQPGRLVALDGAGDPGHRDLADHEPSPRRPRLRLGQPDAAQLGVGEHGVGDRAVVGGEGLALDQVGVHDLVIVEGDVRGKHKKGRIYVSDKRFDMRRLCVYPGSRGHCTGLKHGRKVSTKLHSRYSGEAAIFAWADATRTITRGGSDSSGQLFGQEVPCRP